LTDKNLIEALKTLPPAERTAIADSSRGVRWDDSEAQARLKSSALRKIRSMLKRRARSQREGRKFQWLR
jgi:hypothetical protein